MGNQIDVCFCTGSRSERTLIEPLLKRLKDNPWFNLYVQQFEPPLGIVESFTWISKLIKLRNIDLAFCPFDRAEMLGAALAFYTNNIPVAQLHAGDLSLEGSHDDEFRHMITLCSHIQFCNGTESYQRTLQLLKALHRPIDRCYEVGSIHFDDVFIDYSQVPSTPFDLVVYNPPTREPELISANLDLIESILDKPTLWIEPNEDPGRDLIMARIQILAEEGKVKALSTLPRSQFLGLLGRSMRCIGNSSSFFLELPYFQKGHIHIGRRNKCRQATPVRPGGSDRIVKILEEIYH